MKSAFRKNTCMFFEKIMKTEMSTSVAVVCVGVGMVIGWVLRGRFRNLSFLSRKLNNSPELNLTDSESSATLSDDGEYKMVIVVRNDLKMGKGKAAAQCAHGALGAAEKAMMKNKDAFYAWRDCGQPKVVVKTESEQSLIDLAKVASENGLVCSMIRDAGRTQIPSGTRTVLAVGPGPASLVNKVTGHLKLY